MVLLTQHHSSQVYATHSSLHTNKHQMNKLKKPQLDLIKITTGGGGLYIHCSPNFPLTTRKLKDMVGNGQSQKSLPWVILINLLREVNSSQRSDRFSESQLSQVSTRWHETHPDIIHLIYTEGYCWIGYHPLWCLSQINVQKTAHESERKRCCRTCPWIIRFLSFLQHQSRSVTVLCISTDTLKTGTANG